MEPSPRQSQKTFLFSAEKKLRNNVFEADAVSQRNVSCYARTRAAQHSVSRTRSAYRILNHTGATSISNIKMHTTELSDRHCGRVRLTGRELTAREFRNEKLRFSFLPRGAAQLAPR